MDGLRIVNTVDNSQLEKAFAQARSIIANSSEAAVQQGKKIDSAIDKVASSAAMAGDTLKKRIFESSQYVNELSSKILAQKEVVRDVQADVKRLAEEYRKAQKNGNIGASGKLAEYNAAKKALEEEKTALFALNQEKSKASIKTKELRAQYELMKKSTDDNTLSVNMLAKGFAAIGGMAVIKRFTQQVISTRGEFQQLEVAFETMLGSGEKAKDLMMQLTKTAAITPFDLKGVTDGAKQLLAYGVAADEVNDTLIHLGDIAAGLSLPLGDLVYLYGTTLTQGRMYTQDLRQFMGRGIPLAEELAKQFGVTKDKVQELVSTGKVGAEEFKKAIMSMSAEGGKFGGLMEKQSKTITGQISNIEDSIDVMFNNIGQKTEGVINKSLELVGSLVENYEKVGKVLLSVISVYGVYKASCVAVIATEKIMAAARLAHIRQQTLLQLATDALTKKTAILNKTMLANPYVLVATALAAVIAVMINLSNEEERLKKATERYNETKDEAIRKENEHIEAINELIGIAGDEEVSIDNRRLALIKLEQQYPAIFAKYDTEIEKLEHIRDIHKEIAEYEKSQSIANPVNELAELNRQISELEAKKATETLIEANASGTRMKKIGGLTADEESDLLHKYQKRDELNKQLSKEASDNYFKNLTGITNEELEAQIKERKDILASMKLTGADTGDLMVNGVTNTFSADEIQGQIQILRSEQNRRNEKQYSPSQLKSELARQLAEAKKALTDFDKSSSQMSMAEAEKTRKKLKDAVDEAEKKYKAMGGDTTGKTSKADYKYSESLRKQEQTRRRAAEDMEKETRQAEIDMMRESTEKELAQYKLDFDKKELAIRRGYEDLKQKKIDDARSLFEANSKNSGKTFDVSSVDTSYTKEEQDNYKAMLEANRHVYQENVRNTLDDERKALYDYLIEYGNYEQKKLAITNSYNDRISKAKTQGERQTLQRQMEDAVSSLDMDKLRKDVDWEIVFNDLDRISLEHLQSLRDNLKDTLGDKDITAENAKVIAEQIDRINEQISVKQKEWQSAFGLVIPELERMRRLKEQEVEAQERLNEAQKRQKEDLLEVERIRMNILALAQKEGVSVDYDNINTEGQSGIMSLFTSSGKDISKLSELFSNLSNAESKAAKSTEALASANTEAGVAAESAAGSAATTIAIIDTIIHKINENVQSANELFGQLGLSDTKFGKGFNKFAESSQYATEGWEALKSGNVMGVANGVVGSLRTLGEALGEIGIGFMGNSDTSLKDDIERLTLSNRDLEKAVSNLADMMADSAVVDAAEIYKKQVDDIRQSEANTKELMQRSGANYSNGFLGLFGEHSSNYHIDENVSSSEWERISKIVGRTVESAGDFWSLTSEEMYKVFTEATDIYSHIKSLADDGYADASQYMDEYIEYWKILEGLEDAYYEKLTSVSFDSVESDFANMLMNMDSEAQDFTDSFEDMMRQAIVNSLMSEQYKPMLQEWYKTFASYMASGGTLDNTELEDLREMWNKIVGDAMKERDALYESMNWQDSYSQKASSKGYSAISQDTGEEMNGRMTAIEVGVFDIKDLNIEGNAILSRMENGQNIISVRIEAMQTALATSNIYLEDISKYTKNLVGLNDRLDEIIDKLQYR